MPKLIDATPMQTHQTLHNYQFSAVEVANLGASEYTLVCIVQDTSSSVTEFKDDMEMCLRQILEACQKSPRSENLLLRLVEFNSGLNEIHGFQELSKIVPSTYDDILHPNGMTALIDGTMDSIDATYAYGNQLASQDYTCNAIMFVITDGDENDSRIVTDPAAIADAADKIRREEQLESFQIVLVGVGDDPYVIQKIEDFKNAAKIDQFVKIGEATPQKLAKLADFVSRSISSTSQALGTGKPSQPLTF